MSSSSAAASTKYIFLGLALLLVVAGVAAGVLLTQTNTFNKPSASGSFEDKCKKACTGVASSRTSKEQQEKCIQSCMAKCGNEDKDGDGGSNPPSEGGKPSMSPKPYTSPKPSTKPSPTPRDGGPADR